MSRIASGDTAFSTTVVYYLALAAVSIYAFRGGNLLVAGAFCGSQLRFFIVNVST
jgi:ribosomal protein L30E